MAASYRKVLPASNPFVGEDGTPTSLSSSLGKRLMRRSRLSSFRSSEWTDVSVDEESE